MASTKGCRLIICWIDCSNDFGMEQAVAMESEIVVVALAEAYMLDEADAVHGLEALGAVAAPEVVVDMEALSMVRHLRHGLVGVVLERLNGTEVL